MKAKNPVLALLLLTTTYADDLAAATAADCFNPQLIEQGVVLEYRYRSKDTLTGEKIIPVSTQTVVGREMFKGRNALLATTETSVTQLGVTTKTQSESYFLEQRAKTRVRTLG